MFHFKAFGMINLHYEIKICQKIYNRVTMTVYGKCVVRFNVHKTLGMQKKICTSEYLGNVGIFFTSATL